MTTEIVSPPRSEPRPAPSALEGADGRRGNRIPGLDALRGVAALWVTLFHFTVQNEHSRGFAVPPSVRIPNGSHGVTLFFVISGFVIFMTLERTLRPRDFVVARFSRLYPTYWAAVFLSTTALLLWPRDGTDSPVKLVGKAAVNLTMFQRWFRVSSIDPVYWTLEVELCFYLLMFLLLCGKSLNRAIALFAALALLAVADRLWMPPNAGGPWLDRLRGVLILKYIHIFLAGMLIYRFRETGESRYALLMPVCLVYPALGGVSRGSWLDATFLAVAAGLVYLATTRRLRVLEFPVLQFLGTISYSLYVTHFVIGKILIERMIRSGMSTDLSILTALAVVLSIATLMTFLIERPAMRMIRNAKARRVGRLAPA